MSLFQVTCTIFLQGIKMDKQSHFKKPLFLAVVIPLLAILLGSAVLLLFGAKAENDAMSTANTIEKQTQLSLQKVKHSATEKSEVVSRGSLSDCSDSLVCASVMRTYYAPASMTTEQFKKVLNRLPADLRLNAQCDETDTGTSLCQSTGVFQGRKVAFVYESPLDTEKGRYKLSVSY